MSSRLAGPSDGIVLFFNFQNFYDCGIFWLSFFTDYFKTIYLGYYLIFNRNLVVNLTFGWEERPVYIPIVIKTFSSQPGLALNADWDYHTLEP